MEIPAARPNATSSDPTPDNTVTFIVGFSILIIFVILGMLASAFLCMTLKKDPYLWETERERHLQDQLEEAAKERDKPDESTQI